MVLDLIEQLIPWVIAAIIIFFLWLAVKNKNRLHKIKHTGRVSEMIDRRRNFIFYIVLSVLSTLTLIVYVYNHRNI